MTETTITSTPISDDLSWDIISLCKSAFERTKGRIGNYILVLIFHTLIFICITAVIVISSLGVVFFASLTGASNDQLALEFLVIAGLSLIAYIYTTSWMILSLHQVLLSPTNIKPLEVLKITQPLVWREAFYTFLFIVFLIGLLPWSIPTFGIPIFLWVFWNIFGIYAFLIEKKTGMENVWYSRSLINQNFSGILWRSVVVHVGIFILFTWLANFLKDTPLYEFFRLLNPLLIWPFTISFYYEMYRRLPAPEKYETPKVWFMLYIVGWIILIALIFSFSSTINKFIEEIQNNDYYKKQIEKIQRTS